MSKRLLEAVVRHEIGHQGVPKSSQDEVTRKVVEALTTAREELCATNIYFGGFAARLTIALSRKFPTAATNGKTIWFNPDFVARLLEEDERQVKAVYVHENGHPALGHHLRKGNRNHLVWNLACDYALNGILAKDGFRLPKGALVCSDFDGMSAEEIYAYLLKQGTGGKKSDDEILDPPEKQGGKKGKDKSKGKSKSKSRDSKDDGEEDADEDAEANGKQKEGKSGKKQDDASSAGKDKDEDEDEKDGKSSGDSDSDEDSDEQEDGDGNGDESDEDSDDDGTAPGQDGDEDEDAGQYGDSSDETPEDEEVVFDPCQHQEGKEAETLDPMSEWRLTVANLSALSKRAGQMGGGLAAEIETIKASSVNWKDAFANALENLESNEDNSWSRVDRRMSGHEFLFAGEYSERTRDLVVSLDTSGSVFCEETQGIFASHFSDLVKARNFRNIYVLHVDTRVCHVEVFDAETDEVKLQKQKFGGGGTCFAPGMVWLKDHPEVEPAAMVYLTDMYGSFPTEEQVPEFPIIWLNVSGIEHEIPDHLKEISKQIVVDQNNL